MPPDGAPNLLHARLSTLLDTVPAAQAGDVASVHHARVASRRLREVLPVAGVHAQHATRRALKHVRRVTRALGPVREIDVALEHLVEFANRGVCSPRAIAHVRRGLEREGQARRRAMLSVLTPSRMQKLEKRLARFGKTPLSVQDRANALAAAASRVVHRATRLREAIDRAGAMYLADRLHAVRVAVKKLRYALEIQRELARSRATARIRQLKAVQELLGRLHDLEILIEHTRSVQARTAMTDRPSALELDRLIRALEDDCRELHAEYMTRRTALVRVSEALEASAVSRRRRRPAA
ncbi:MAG: CHAD domain-containing protein [Acidobacteria bacterium]|nr:CHAD domain-containing protein [Acidobacteriota bacterium]